MGWGLWRRANAKLFWTTVEIKHNDPLYNWVMDWLAEQREVQSRGGRVRETLFP